MTNTQKTKQQFTLSEDADNKLRELAEILGDKPNSLKAKVLTAVGNVPAHKFHRLMGVMEEAANSPDDHFPKPLQEFGENE